MRGALLRVSGRNGLARGLHSNSVVATQQQREQYGV